MNILAIGIMVVSLGSVSAAYGQLNPAPSSAGSYTGLVSVSAKSGASNPGAIVPGERLSEWMLKDRQAQQLPSSSFDVSTPYYLGTSWLTPRELTAQEMEKQRLLQAFAQLPFPENDPSTKRIKAAFTQLINRMQVTGRVVLPNTNPRYLEVNPKLDPILEEGDAVVIPPTPTTITVIRNNGSLCTIRYRPNVETRFYVQGCALRGKNNKSIQGDADWAWLIEPDGTTHRVSLAAWNASKQDLPAPGSWIWAPPRWSMWTTQRGETFTNALTTMLATQGPSGLSGGLDDAASTRGSLPPNSPNTLYSVSRDLPISANIWGETGLMQTPSARTAPAGTGAITFGWFNPYANVNLFFAPVNGIEFILRYTNMNNVVYGASGGTQTNKDKSVGLKVRLLNENYYLPEIAVGARDMLGTGLFSGEYVVASKRYRDFDFTGGIGWGQLGTRNNVTNPFVSAFGQNFATRSAGTANQGGTPTGQFFHGTSALFGGVQYHTPWNPLVLKIEADGNNYQQLPYGETLPNKSIFNYGVTYQMKNVDFTLGVIGNSQVMFTISLHDRLDKLSTPKLAEAKPVPVQLKPVGSYNPIRSNTIANTSAGTQTTVAVPASMQTAPAQTQSSAAVNSSSSSAGQGELSKQTMTDIYTNTLIEFEQQTQWQVKSLQGNEKVWSVHLLDASGVFIRSRINRGVAVLHRDAPSHIETFQIQFYNWGMLVSEFSINRKDWMLGQTQLLPPSMRVPTITTERTALAPADGDNPFFWGSAASASSASKGVGLRPPASASANASGVADESLMINRLNHSPLQTNLGISYVQVVGSPDSPLLFSLGVRADALYKFRENTWITGTINTRVIDNFGKYNYDPPPTGLQPVRTDIRQYMTQSIATLPNLQLTNTGKLGNNHFVSAYGGYLEMMFAGVGGEYLWRPTNSSVAVGADLNRVRQRQFNVWTSLQNYAVTTGHLTTYWDTGVQDILVKLSYGKYLAGDVGGTLDLSRVFQNGVKIGAYATRTNVNYAQFGEGSFDKGVYLSIPFDAFFARHSDSSADLLFTPLIRDGGAKLFRKYQLYDMTRTRDPRALSVGPN
jgi:hypothetical protein